MRRIASTFLIGAAALFSGCAPQVKEDPLPTRVPLPKPIALLRCITDDAHAKKQVLPADLPEIKYALSITAIFNKERDCYLVSYTGPDPFGNEYDHPSTNFILMKHCGYRNYYAIDNRADGTVNAPIISDQMQAEFDETLDILLDTYK